MDNELVKNLTNLAIFHGIISLIAWTTLMMLQRKSKPQGSWFRVLPFVFAYFATAMVLNALLAGSGIRVEFARIVALAGGHVMMYWLFSRSVRAGRS